VTQWRPSTSPQFATTANSPSRQFGQPLGRLAQSALTAGPGWYVLGFLASVLLPIIAIFYIAIALFQLRAADNYHGLARARVMLCIYAVLCLFSIVPMSTAVIQYI
jgi:hypothetical protein